MGRRLKVHLAFYELKLLPGHLYDIVIAFNYVSELIIN